MTGKVKYVTVSIPKAVADRIDYCVDKLAFWPSRSSFVREAVLEKCDRVSQNIVMRNANKRDPVSIAEEMPKAEFDVADQVEESA